MSNNINSINNPNNKSFKISVIMAVYNTENYLNQAIDSILHQTIGFRENIQLILVNDGSTDDSEDIMRSYQEQYPDNIIVISQENQGQSAARNNGLNYVRGKIVNFLDSDDYISESAFEDVYYFFLENYDKTDVVSIPYYSFGRIEQPHKLNYKYESTRIIDLLEEPDNPQLSASSAFIKYDVLKDFTFSTDLIGSEDALLINMILLNKKTLGVVNSAQYYYRKRKDASSTIDVIYKIKEGYTDRLENYFMELINYSISKVGYVPEFIQYTLAYDLQWIIQLPNLKYVFDKKGEIPEFWKIMNDVISHIEDDAIINNRGIVSNQHKSFLIYLKNLELRYEIKDDDIVLMSADHQLDKLKDHSLHIDIIEIKNDTLNISGYTHTHFKSDKITIQAVINNNSDRYLGKMVHYPTRDNVKFLSIPWTLIYNFDMKIPLDVVMNSQVKIKVNYHIDGDTSNFSNDNLISDYLQIKFSKNARLSKTSIYSVRDSKVILFKNNSFYINKYDFFSILRHERSIFKKILQEKKFGYKEILKIKVIYLLKHFLNGYRKPIYLFMDRPEQGDDNGEHLFKYALTCNDNIRKYFIVEEDSKTFKPVSRLGEVVPYKSLKHKLLFLFVDKIITSHPDEPVINPFFSYSPNKDERHFISGLGNAEIYFLQHGVTKDNITPYLKKYDKNLSLIVTVSDKEHDSFMDDGYNYEENIIQTLGFPRYDNLESHPRKQILIIPTWRDYLEGNEELFVNSGYYTKLNDLLNDERLIKLAKEYGYKIVFKPHPRLMHKINEKTNKRYIDLIKFNPYIRLSIDDLYQELFSDSSLLITDYSSVFFDFAYLKKPVIYYHPNNDYHHLKSYFDYNKMGFGSVEMNDKSLINKIAEYLENDCEMEDIYKQRVDQFFKFHDKHNSQRVYDWIKNH